VEDDPWLTRLLDDVYESLGAMTKARGSGEFSAEESARYWALVDELEEIDDAMREARAIDWSNCTDVEAVPGRCSGAWVVKDSRVIVESCILGNAEAGCSAEEIADMFEVPGGVDVVRRILAFARAAR
jgi:uncharacterized protein (DUF433 family)